MDEKSLIRIFLSFTLMLASWSVDAHQPVLNSESIHNAKSPYIIEEPEISKAILSELKGDPHYYRIDKPLKDKHGNTYLHFTRMEVFGSPNVAGVVVSVTPTTKEVFSFQPYYLRTP